MLEQALKRLFLILFPLSLLLLGLFLTNKYRPLRDQTPFPLKNESKDTAFLKSRCPFYLGISFFPIEEKKQTLLAGKKPLQFSHFKTDLLSEEKFKKTLTTLKKDFKKEKLLLKRVLFVFPLALTKDEKWIISRKTFVIFPNGERKELSHLTYSEIKNLYEKFMEEFYKPLTLEAVFSYLPNRNFLFHLKGSNREKIIRNLNKNFKGKTEGTVYLSSSNEKLLREISTLSEDWNILHSFKSLMRFQIMNILHLDSFKNLPGKGFVIPSSFSFSSKSLSSFQNQKKLLFLEKDSPYHSINQTLIQKSQALISSQPKQVLSIVKTKKPCLIKK